MKKNIIIGIISIIILMIILIFVIPLFSDNTYPRSVKIINYNAGEKTIVIKNKEEIKKIGEYVNQLKVLSEEESVDLVLIRDVVLEYGDDIKITFQLSEDNYCDYHNDKTKVYGLSKLPSKLNNYIKKMIK